MRIRHLPQSTLIVVMVTRMWGASPTRNHGNLYPKLGNNGVSWKPTNQVYVS